MHIITAQFDLQKDIDDYMETFNWQSCAGYLGRVGSILNQTEGWMIGALTEEEEELAGELMMSAIQGRGKKGNKGLSTIGEGAMSAMQAKEELVNPHTVS